LHKNEINNLIYLNKNQPINKLSLIEESDLILLYEPQNTVNLAKKYQDLAMGIIKPKDIESSYSKQNLNSFYQLKKPIIPFTPPLEIQKHKPYFNLYRKTNELETEIKNSFESGDIYKSLNLTRANVKTYKESFLYLYSHLYNQLENIEEIIQNFNQNLSYENKNILIISSPKLLEFKFIYPNLIGRQYHTESHFHLSIRHEIFRREILNLEIKENMFNAYLLECVIKKSSNQTHVDYCKTSNYIIRNKLLSVDESKLQQLSYYETYNELFKNLNSI